MTTPPPPSDSGSYGYEPDEDEKTLAMVCHFLMVLFLWLPALIIYLMKSDSSWVKNEAAKEFNFAIAVQIVYVMVFFVGIIVGILDIAILGCLVWLLYFGIWVAVAIIAVLNGMKINNDEVTKYPFEIPVLK